MRRISRRAGLLLTALAAGCGGTAFSPHFRDNTLEDVNAALRAARLPAELKPENRTGQPMLFLLATNPVRIIAHDLAAGRAVWEAIDDVTSKVVVGDSLVFHRSGKKTLVARSLASGQKVWSAPMEGGDRLIGVATDGTDVYYVTEYAERTEEGVAAVLVALRGSNGRKKWVRPSQGRLGAPEAVPGQVYLPVRFQSLAVLSAEDGVEVARVRSKEEMILWVRVTPAGVLYGGKSGVYRLDAKAVSGTREGSSFFAADLPTSVRPVYWWDGYNAALSGYTAFDRNRLLWRMGKGDLRLQGDTIFVHNYRFFFAFDAKPGDAAGTGKGKADQGKVDQGKATVATNNVATNDDAKGNATTGAGAESGKATGAKPAATEQEDVHGELRWVYSFPRNDVVASVHTGDAILLVSANGVLVALDLKTGVPVLRRELGVSVRGATFDAGGYAPPAGKAQSPKLRKALTEVIWDPDRRFGAVKLFAVEQLARLPGGTVSEDLVRIVTHEGIDPAVYKLAGQVLVDRHDRKALPLYLETLRSKFNFVKGTGARAVDIMARAVADLKAADAVPPLTQHLMDHETSLATVEAVVRALVSIGDKSVLTSFRDFLLMYRADPSFEKKSMALNMVADGMLALGGEEERQILRFVQNDTQTIGPLRAYLAEAMKQDK